MQSWQTKKNNIVKLSLSAPNQQLVVSVDAPDVGSGREAVPAQISGDDMEIAFNVKYLLEGLKVITATEVQMQFNTPHQSIDFDSSGWSQDDLLGDARPDPFVAFRIL